MAEQKLKKCCRKMKKLIKQQEETINSLGEAVEELLHDKYYGDEEEVFQEEPGQYEPIDDGLIYRASPPPDIRWVSPRTKGWLLVLTDPGGKKVSLPEHLELELTKQTPARDYVTALEGIHKGKKFSIKTGYITDADPHKPFVTMEFNKRTTPTKGYTHDLVVTQKIPRPAPKQPRTVKKKVPAMTDPQNPVPTGVHNVQIPDYPHGLGAGYGNKGTLWFLIKPRSGAKYVHPGRISAGCVTCMPDKWQPIYDMLITARLNDGEHVGTIIVP
ncbi:MAG: hypothetical protein ABW185_21870 [Sedimenticola sp.]